MRGQHRSTEIFETMSVREAVRVMAVPAVISQLIVLMYNLADTFFIGKTNDPYMVAGVSLMLPVFNVTMVLGSLFGVGGGALLPKLLAVGRRDEAERANMFCIRMAVLVSLVFSACVAIFMEPLLRLLGAGENTYIHARSYTLLVIVIGGIPTVLTSVLSSLLRSVSLSRQASTGVALGGILNIILDPLFMFVILPPGNEVMGVGIATLLSNVISSSYCLWVLTKRQDELKVSGRISGVERGSIKAILLIGIPGAINTLLFDMDYIVLDKLMSGYGDIALAAIGIVLKAERLPLQAGIGLCQAIVPLVAYSYTGGNFKRMRETVYFTAFVGVVISVASIAMYELFAPYILRFFIKDSQTVLLGARFLQARAFATIFMFLSFYVVHLYQAFGKGHMALFLGSLRWAVLNIPLLFLFNHLFGMYGLVWSQLVSDVIVVIVSFLFLLGFMNRLDKKIGA